jgi:hypothetical protein
MPEPLEAATVTDQIKDWETDYADWVEEARTAYDFVAGEQWDDDDKSAMEAAGRPVVSLNLVAAFVRGICGLEVGNRQEARYLPREMGDVQVNELLNAAAAWVRDECAADDEESEAFRDLVICGIGACEVRVDFGSDPAGEILIERIDPLQLRWDTAARKRNLSDARWIAYGKRLTRSEIERMWPGAAVSSDTDGEDWDEGDITGEPHDREAARRYQGGTGGRDTSRGIKVWQYQYWEDADFVRITGPNGQSMEVPAAQYKAIASRITPEMGVEVKPTKKRVYRQAFVTRGEVLEDKELPVDSFSICLMTGFRDRNGGFWYGFVRDVSEPQRVINKMYSLGLDILANDAKGGLLAEKDAFENVRQAEEDWANPRKIIWMRPGGTAKIQPRQSGSLPAALQSIFQSTVDLFPQVSGVSVEFLGTADRAQAGVLEHLRKQSTITTLAELFASLSSYRRRSGKVLAEYIVKFLGDGRLIRVVGKESERYVPLLFASGALEFDVIVDEAPASSDVKGRTFAVLQDLLPMAIQAGIPVPPSVVDYMPLPSALASEWKQLLTKPNIPPELQQQIEMGKAIIMQQQQEIQALKSDNSAKMAELQAKWAASAKELELKQVSAEREAQLKREMAVIDRELEAEKAAAEIILQREKWLGEYQLDMAQAAVKNDMEALKAQAEQVRAERELMMSELGPVFERIDAAREEARTGIESLASRIGGKRRKRVTVERDKSGRIISAMVEHEDDAEGED